jgi:hypothetical protein
MLKWIRFMPFILAIILFCATLTSSFGQDFKKGDVVFVVQDTELKMGAKNIGTVYKGNRVTVESVQDNWLWVRSGEISGWINNKNVDFAWQLKGSWKVLEVPKNNNQWSWSNTSSPIITFDGNRSGKGLLIDAGWGNDMSVSRDWTYDGKTLKWSGWSEETVFNIKLYGKWKIDWKTKDEIEVTDSGGEKMQLTRYKVPKKK